jgi:hypothetical protein
LKLSFRSMRYRLKMWGLDLLRVHPAQPEPYKSLWRGDLSLATEQSFYPTISLAHRYLLVQHSIGEQFTPVQSVAVRPGRSVVVSLQGRRPGR